MKFKGDYFISHGHINLNTYKRITVSNYQNKAVRSKSRRRFGAYIVMLQLYGLW
ncbi:MAG: hypothetical protein UT08_C0009G0008 [Candidatus Woesebacteria bacterium GW2011_GWB1_38_8]|uniref:Uncharacterized protein n=1 Tax=Candidatus Woesebacteria bacterium GW2011_GWB1_38_8 TaxID=1618570 RepID=A0A0G0NH17_9BACT|nr:MAG: hypothetical protein UT08_C0009G0008 [Candidatus Woesebacteria bacterium GW2011_GWB1_38_8]